VSKYPKVNPRTACLNTARVARSAMLEAWRIEHGLSWGEYLCLLSEEITSVAGMWASTERGES